MRCHVYFARRVSFLSCADKNPWEGVRAHSASMSKVHLRSHLARITRHMGLALLVAAIPVMLITVTPSCEMARWQATPGVCWQRSWHRLVARITANMAATRGFPLAVVEIEPGSPHPDERN